jgi:hypothetical protein
MNNGWVGFHAEPVAGIPGLKSETWGTLRFLPTLRWIRKETADPSASLGMTKERLNRFRRSYGSVKETISELSGCRRTTFSPLLMSCSPVRCVSGEVPSSKCKW